MIGCVQYCLAKITQLAWLLIAHSFHFQSPTIMLPSLRLNSDALNSSG